MRLILCGALLGAGLFGCSGSDMPDAGSDLGGIDMGGPCDGVSDCTDENALSCIGSTLTRCAEDENGCFVLTAEEDCAMEDGGFCNDSGAVATCDVDPCELIPDEEQCNGDTRLCSGDTLTVCAMDENACFRITETDCAAEAIDGFCDSSGEVPACNAPADPCEGLPNSCDIEGSSCDETTAVVCAPNAFGCLVETQTDCTLGGGSATCVVSGQGAVCNNVTRACSAIPGAEECSLEDEGAMCAGPVLSECARDVFGCFRRTELDCTSVQNGFCNTSALACEVSRVDLCAGVPQCDELNRECNGLDLVVCERDPRGCQVEITTDCTERGDICSEEGEAPACVASTCPQAVTQIDCDSGTVTADTADGTDFFDRYSCVIGDRPAGNEFGYTFTTAEDVRVTFSAAPTSETTENYDLFVLAGENDRTDCNAMTECLARGEDEGASETVTIDLRGGEEAYVFYDIIGILATETTEFDLTVSCVPANCGDGLLGPFEACDDGNMDDEDGCSSECAVEAGFSCDDAEPTVCTPLCGNGVLDAGEACDDGNTDDEDGCSSACVVEEGFTCDESEPSVCTEEVPVCGDGVIEGTEECDDMNMVDNDGCSGCVVDRGFECFGEPSECEEV